MSLMYILQSEVEETLKRIQAHKGVTGIIVVNSEGTVLFIFFTLEKSQDTFTYRYFT